MVSRGLDRRLCCDQREDGAERTSKVIVNGFKLTPRDTSDQIRKSAQSAPIHGSRALVWLLERNCMAGAENECGWDRDGDGDATVPFNLVRASLKEMCAVVREKCERERARRR